MTSSNVMKYGKAVSNRLESVSVVNGGAIRNVCSATGEKLKTFHSMPVSSGTVATTVRTTITYRGNVIYRNGAVDMVLFPGGYVYTSSALPAVGQVENAAHELLGHAYFQELKSQGYNVNPFHTASNVQPSQEMVDEFTELNEVVVVFNKTGNDRLENHIKTVTDQAIRNYKSRTK